MEREILFRGKLLIDNSEWGYGSLLVWPDGDMEISEPYKEMSDEMLKYQVDPATVGQYTGLKDKNGQNVFEGDIFHFGNTYNDSTWLCAVEYLNGSFICRYVEHEGHLGVYNHFGSWNDCVYWEIIGNIHDNPEPLEVKG